MRDIKFRLFSKNSIEFLRPENVGHNLEELQNLCDINQWYVMQYTGLKDINDEDIYEGDVLTIWIQGCKQTHPYIVEDIRHLYLETERDDSYYCISKMEIIGNIYTNPELRK